MSRIGKLPIKLPKGVEVSISDDNVLTVKGPLGQLTQKVNPDITMNVEDGEIHFFRPSDSKEHKAMHGLYRALAANMVKGVSEGFKMEMDLGYSHKIFFELAPEIKVETVTEKGKNPIITMTSIDKQILGQAAAKIRSLRKPEPYKGKGIRFQGEVVRKKAGKAAAK